VNSRAGGEGPLTATGVSAGAVARSKIPPLYLIIVFWGEEFRNLFLDITVASLLAPGNAPAITDKENARLVICTSREDWDKINEDSRFQLLSRLISPHFVDIGDRYWHWKYHKMAHGHRLAIRFAYEARAAGIHLNPDTLFPDGCIRAAERYLRAGYDLVLCHAVRFDMEGVVAEVEKAGYLASDGSIIVPMREAAGIGVRNLHSETLAGNFDARNFGELHPQHTQTHFPICVYFEVPDEDGIVMYGHNWAPFVMNYDALEEHDDSSFEHWTIDGSYVFDNFDRRGLWKNITVVTDSDDLFLLGMTPRDEMALQFDWRWWKGRSWFGEWNKGYLINRVFYVRWLEEFRRDLYPVYGLWHGRELNAKWDPVLERSTSTVAKYIEKDLHPSKAVDVINDRGFWAFAFSRPLSESIRFFWYWLVFRKGVPEIRELGDERGHEWVRITRFIRLKRAVNRRIGVWYNRPTT